MTPPQTPTNSREHTSWKIIIGCLSFLVVLGGLIYSDLSAGFIAMALTVATMVVTVRFMVRLRREGRPWLSSPMPVSIQLLSIAATGSWIVYALWIHSDLLLWINIVAFVISCVSLRVGLAGRRLAAKAVASEDRSPEAPDQ